MRNPEECTLPPTPPEPASPNHSSDQNRGHDHSLLIAGHWLPSKSGATRPVLSPCNGAPVATVAEAGAEDVDLAVTAARAAFEDGRWAATAAPRRAELLNAIADELQRQRADLAALETRNTGKTLAEAEVDVDDSAAVFRYYAELLQSAEATSGPDLDIGREGSRSRVVYEPVGVCSLITPWNYPLLQISWKLAPALAAGCTCVAKPSELTPLTTLRLFDIAQQLLDEAGAPAGTVNLVLGGAVAGAALSSHPEVDLVSFTGGAASGKAVLRAAAETVKRTALELGGKNPLIIFADTDLDTAVDYALTAAFLHSGQVCSAGSRILVERPLHDAFVAELARRADLIRVGDGAVPGTETGPLISAAQRAKVEAYIAGALAEGAELLAGGGRPTDPSLADGFYLRPTVLDGCHPEMTVVREEVFGPVATIEVFDSEAEAVRLGNATVYGLAAGVFSADAERAERVAARLRAGTVWVNDFGPYVPQAEWGGFKQSGNGRELGVAGLREYQEAKHVWSTVAPAPQYWFGAHVTVLTRRPPDSTDLGLRTDTADSREE